MGGAGGAAGPVRWARLSAGSSWGWFDHRLHPQDLRAPGDRTRSQELGRWSVALRYGGEPVTARGTVRFVPLRGAVQVDLDPAPPGVSAQVLQGRLPGLFLAADPARQVVVLDADGEPYLELGRSNRRDTGSRTHVEDQQARGVVVPAPDGEVRWEPLPGPSASWLDPRLAVEPVGEDVAAAGEPAVLRRWEVPLLVDGRPVALSGQVRWVPGAELERAVRTAAPGGGAPRGLLVGGAAGLLLAGAVLARAAEQGPAPHPR